MSFVVIPETDSTNIFHVDYVSEPDVLTSDDEVAFDALEHGAPADELDQLDVSLTAVISDLETAIGEDTTMDTSMLSVVFDLNRTFVERLLVFIERYNTYSDDLAEQDKTLFMMDRKLERVQRRLAQERRTNRIDLQRADARYVNENFIYRMCSEELEACSEELRDVKEELDIELRR